MDGNGQYPQRQGLYDPVFEKGSCGVGFIANAKGIKSYEIIENGLQILKNMSHRGATGADPETGDGAGLLIQIPHKFFKDEFKDIDVELPEENKYGVGMVFLPMEPNARYYCEGVFERVVKEEGLELISWREVPVFSKACGVSARGTQPFVKQIFVKSKDSEAMVTEQTLYMIRKRIENIIGQSKEINKSTFYICSLSTKTIIYKGQFLAHQIEKFYLELSDKRMESSIATVHQRYSTNTFPSWSLAHPYRYIAHNGEINTIRGNVKWVSAREGEITSKTFGDDLEKVLPIVDGAMSDSANLDSIFEFLLLNGYEMEHALKMLMPEAWRYYKNMSPKLRSFYEYHEGLMEPWDGPATVVYTDGAKVGVALDRNGLRPARFVITDDDIVIVASESGVLDIPEERIVEKGKLGPGEIFVVNTDTGKISFDADIKANLCEKKVYDQWIKKNKVDHTVENKPLKPRELDADRLLARQINFGYTEEELKRVIAPLASNGKEAVNSMGNDVPLGILSDKSQLMFSYFRQVFAQVTNPAIDPIREKKVMSLNQYLGRSGNIIHDFSLEEDYPFVEIEQPILYREKIERIRNLGVNTLKSVTIPMLFEDDRGEGGLKEAIDSLLSRVEESIGKGYRIIILSDKGADRYRAGIPSVLAISAVHNHLINIKLRTQVDLIIETGEARDAFHMALLIGYGATAVYPYLAFDSIEKMIQDNLYMTEKDLTTASMNYVRGLNYGLRKITSKMGISTIRSFHGAQIFEILGLDDNLVETYFTGTPNKLSGIGLDIIAKETLIRHEDAFKVEEYDQKLALGGSIHSRKGEDVHLLTPDTIGKLQHSCRTDDYDLYKEYAALVNDQSKSLKTVRGLLQFKACKSIPLEEVESVESIIKSFATGAMSFGSLGKEVHETLAVAMNRIGAKSNSGEGGEDLDRYIKAENGDYRRSAIKQIAAARFGVDTNYLVEADELQIKVSQGAKPGEGGHLPGKKVTEAIAKVRNSLPGIDLISPPPHHDIYSIEDLEQLIFDLKNVNTEARVSVKLVSESGVGTIAAGVAKGSADMVLISGHDGGTGAAPVTSVKTTGLPWEIGLAETHQTLLLNNLRSRIAVQVDGQLRTGRDVAIGALLGAEEFGFATAPLIVCGCILMRKCHDNTCPVGVATQDPELRKHFKGKPEHVINFFRFIAMELREIMSELGIKELKDMVGRVDLLETNNSTNNWKTGNLDLSSILHKPELPSSFASRKTEDQVSQTEDVLDRELIKLSKEAIEGRLAISINKKIGNLNRAVGTMLSGEIAKIHGKKGLKEGAITLNLEGTAGQSFGAFLISGVTLKLSGDANDYVGKGLSGGKIIVKPHESSIIKAEDNIIAGNTILYGATSGEAYLCGKVGERFAVRNSGAMTVVEGIGDHGCEYMTGGRVVILGKTGRNFGAGMSGGIAYVYDEDKNFANRCNYELVDLDEMDARDMQTVKDMVMKHNQYTGSKKGQKIMSNWEIESKNFVKVISQEYKNIISNEVDYNGALVG